jgi:hypothetical protein
LAKLLRSLIRFDVFKVNPSICYSPPLELLGANLFWGSSSIKAHSASDSTIPHPVPFNPRPSNTYTVRFEASCTRFLSIR